MKIIQTHLDCRATAALIDSIADDLSQADKPISDLLSDLEITSDEPKDQPPSSD